MPLHHYLVHKMHCIRDGIGLVYVGMTGVHAGQSDRAALEERRRWHSEEPVLWLEGADMSCQRLRVEVTNLSRRSDALAEEARVTAMQCKALGTRTVRGGPWCLRGLSAADRREIKLVGECQSRAARCTMWADRCLAGRWPIIWLGSDMHGQTARPGLCCLLSLLPPHEVAGPAGRVLQAMPIDKSTGSCTGAKSI